MKTIFVKWLSALLVACMLLSTVALMEEAAPGEGLAEIDAEENAVVNDEAEGEEDTDKVNAGPEDEAEIEIAGVDEIQQEETVEFGGEEEFVSDEACEAMEPAHTPTEETIFDKIEDAAFRKIVRLILNLNDDVTPTDEQIGLISEFNSNNYAAITGTIQTLKGIEAFPNLLTLNLEKCISLKTLNLSGYTPLTKLVGSHALEELNLSGCTGLTFLSLSGASNLVKLDASGCVGLNYQNCNSLVKLTDCNFSGCTKLEQLSCQNCNITSLNVSGCSKLETLECNGNQLTSLDVTSCVALKILYCENNKLTSLDVCNNVGLQVLHVYGNAGLSKLDISNCVFLLPIISNQYREEEEGRITFGRGYEWEYDIPLIVVSFDKGTELITPPATSRNVTPSGEDWFPMIDVTRKNTRVTIKAVPGTLYYLDVYGATGKKFKSSRKKIATVSSTGLVTVKKMGKTTITFMVGKKKHTLTLTIKDPTIPGSVTINAPATAVKKGDVITLTANLPAGTNSPIKWKSSNKKVAKVSNGVVTFKKAGKATITATATRGKKKARVTFRVSK